MVSGTRRPQPFLLAGGGLELDDQPGRDPATVLYLDAVRPGPLADLGGVHAVRRSPAAAARCGPPGRAADTTGGAHIAGQGVTQFPGVSDVQVDLILRAVQPEADGPLGIAAWTNADTGPGPKDLLQYKCTALTGAAPRVSTSGSARPLSCRRNEPTRLWHQLMKTRTVRPSRLTTVLRKAGCTPPRRSDRRW